MGGLTSPIWNARKPGLCPFGGSQGLPTAPFLVALCRRLSSPDQFDAGIAVGSVLVAARLCGWWARSLAPCHGCLHDRETSPVVAPARR